VSCSRSLQLIQVINHCYTLKTQGGNTFKKIVNFVSSFLIGWTISDGPSVTLIFFKSKIFCSNISEESIIWSDNLYFFGNWPLKIPNFNFLATTPSLADLGFRYADSRQTGRDNDSKTSLAWLTTLQNHFKSTVLNLTLRLQKKKSDDIFKKNQNFQKKMKIVFSILRPRK
jgi:hypothetical protein